MSEPISKPPQAKKKVRGDRTADMELERRIREVTKMIIKGTAYSDVVEACENQWKVSEATSWRYIEEAKERFKAQWQKDAASQAEIYKQRFEAIANAAISEKKFSDATSALNSAAKLMGLFVDRVEAKVDVEDGVSKLLREIRATRPEIVHLTTQSLPSPTSK
jgi:hypothetical protein